MEYGKKRVEISAFRRALAKAFKMAKNVVPNVTFVGRLVQGYQ